MSDEVELESENWDGVFGMRVSMLPKHLVTAKTAEKILFVGKCIRVFLTFEDLRTDIFDEKTLGVIKSAA